MPYRNAHRYGLGLLPLAAFAFWPGYLSRFAASPAEFHVHGTTATLWLLLLAAQGWTMHNGRRQAHRRLGQLSLLLFPLFLAGGSGIFIGMADRFAAGLTPFHRLYAPKLAWIDLVAVAGFAFCYFEGLRRRRELRAHSGYMLATSLFLLPPIFGRIAGALPMIGPSGPADFWKLDIAFQLGNAASIAVALVIAWRSGRGGSPFRLVAGLILVSALLYQFAGPAGWWQALYRQAATLPVAPVAVAIALAGAAIAYAGWVGGRRDAPAPSLAAA
jgi:hypothetical protein